MLARAVEEVGVALLLAFEPVQPPSKPSNSWAELAGRNHNAGHMPSEVSGILARIWTYQPVEGSVNLEVTAPETHLYF